MRTRTKRFLIIGLVLALVCVGGGYFGYKGYRSARQARLVRQAKEFLDQGNSRKALLCVQRALRYNSRDVQACRLMAELAEKARSPAALVWRNRVVEIETNSTEDQLALVQTALMFRDFAAATNTLAKVSPEGKKTAAYQNIAGAVATSLNQLPEAEAHFSQAVQLEPGNAAPQINLAIVRLHGTNAAAMAEARLTLKRISENPTNSTFRCQSLRELIVDAMRFKRTDEALALSGTLLQQTNSAFRDRLLRLDILKENKDPTFKDALAQYQKEAATDNGKVFELATWQMARTSPQETLAWLLSLPPETQTNQPAALVIAECQTSSSDWPALQKTLQGQKWGELEPLRHAFITRALRGQDMTAAATAEWQLALNTAQNQKTSLTMLLKLAAQWKWQTEAEQLLWDIFNHYPDDKGIVQALMQTLYAGGRTRSLLMLFTQLSKQNPSDLFVQNNLAMTALLLDANELKPSDIAKSVFEKAPTNSSFASTYAFALHLQKKDDEALKIFEKLPPKDLEQPSIAGYFGLVLKATGDMERAKAYLNWAFKGSMLPEERKLFEQARTGASSKPEARGPNSE